MTGSASEPTDMAASASSGIGGTPPPKPWDAVPDTPENPREFRKLLSGISGMREDLREKEDAIRKLQRELNKCKKVPKDESNDPRAVDSGSRSSSGSTGRTKADPVGVNKKLDQGRMNASSGSGIGSAPPPAPRDAVPNTPENPGEFGKLLSGISGMREDLREKEEAIRKLQRELDECKKAIKDESNNSRTVDSGGQSLSGSTGQADASPVWVNKRLGQGKMKIGPPRDKATGKAMGGRTESQRAAVEAFIAKVKRGESTTVEWERLVRKMKAPPVEEVGGERKQRRSVKDKRCGVLGGVEGGGSNNSRTRGLATIKEEKEEKEPPSVEVQMIRTLLKVVILVVILLSGTAMLDGAGGKASGSGGVAGKNWQLPMADNHSSRGPVPLGQPEEGMKLASAALAPGLCDSPPSRDVDSKGPVSDVRDIYLDKKGNETRDVREF